MATILLTHSPSALNDWYGERALTELRKVGEVKLNFEESSLEGEALIAAGTECDLIISHRQSSASALLFERLPRLCAFLRCAVDIRNIDVEAASRSGVLITQASAGFVTSVAELVLGFLVDLSRNITNATIEHRANRPLKPIRGKELKGSIMGVIGYGAVEKEVARIGMALNMNVLVHDPYVTVTTTGIEQVSFDELLSRSDYVIPLATATAETENLINSAAFSLMKHGAYLINVSRGNLIDERALKEALDSGKLAGCAMDVGRAPDQMPSPHIASHPNVIATPHVGGFTLPSVEHQSLETVAQAAEIIKGNVPKGVVNAEHWRRRIL